MNNGTIIRWNVQYSISIVTKYLPTAGCKDANKLHLTSSELALVANGDHDSACTDYEFRQAHTCIKVMHWLGKCEQPIACNHANQNILCIRVEHQKCRKMQAVWVTSFDNNSSSTKLSKQPLINKILHGIEEIYDSNSSDKGKNIWFSKLDFCKRHTV